MTGRCLAMRSSRRHLGRYVLIERSAQRHVEGLDTATDGEERYVLSEGQPNKRKLIVVARGIDLDGIVERALPVQRRIDIVSTGEEQAVQPIENRVPLIRLDDVWKKNGSRAGEREGVRIGPIESILFCLRALIERARTARDTDEGTAHVIS